MAKKEKLKTPDWIMEGYDSKEEYDKAHGKSTKKPKGKIFKIRLCPNCGSDSVGVVLGQEEGRGNGEWECRKCKWKGKDVKIKEIGEDELLKFLKEEE
jgi:hypothetical protein